MNIRAATASLEAFDLIGTRDAPIGFDVDPGPIRLFSLTGSASISNLNRVPVEFNRAFFDEVAIVLEAVGQAMAAGWQNLLRNVPAMESVDVALYKVEDDPIESRRYEGQDIRPEDIRPEDIAPEDIAPDECVPRPGGVRCGGAALPEPEILLSSVHGWRLWPVSGLSSN